ncbi:DNA-directed RNA polymerases IV and V subunit 5B-like [Rhododendron vialii]|uniref:DNA-directed RNA polymerases IV and V subunit 5B-like n=1 Tax=Rhododendron vialii TaxID=182163 RepID=UPI00265EB5F4|nr:DNA-directed RNA polymerases IV and V subunit 5B-like [Rhododendron vialii]
MEGGGAFGSGGDGGGGGSKPPCITSMVVEGSMEGQRNYLARRTVLEMLKDRGYTVSDLELTLSLSDFLSAYGHKPDLDRLRICASLRSNPSKKILVIFCGTDEIRKQNMAGMLNQIANKESLHRVMLILQSKMNYHARKLADEYSVKVETFHITDLLANITKHVLMPKYEILTVGEKQKLLKKYNVEDKQMPRMLENDAISKYYGLEKGQVVKVTHNGAFTDSLVSYRCVT